MRKLLQILTLVMGIFAIGCQTDNTAEDEVGVGDNTTLTVSLAQSRVALGGKVGDTYPVYWNEGDKIVVNGKLSDEVDINAENRSMATFTFTETSISYPYCVTYPYCASTTAEQSIVEFPAEQNYAEGSFEIGSAPMCGYVESKGSLIRLNHLASALRFSVKTGLDNVVLDRIVITSNAGAKLSGEFVVDCQNATISATENTSNVVTYNLPDNFVLSNVVESVFYISLPAVAVGNCTIEFIEASGERMVASWTPNKPLSKGVVREFKGIDYQQRENVILPAFGTEKDDLIFMWHKKYADNDELKIMSFNVRTKTTESNTANNWDNRKEACVELIEDQRPSIIGFQEARYTSQWSYLKEELKEVYDGYGVNRDTGEESGTGEVMGIMYDKYVVEKIDGGTFWLSETPDTPSKGFGAGHSRNATWGLFKHIPTGKTFYYINTHLDHKVEEAQIEGMKLISQHFEANKQYPRFLTGDMNITSENVALDVVEGYMYNTREVAPSLLTDFYTTYNGYTTTKSSIIDHIYCSKELEVVEYHTINESYGGVAYVSDHYPIYAIVKLQ